MLEKSLEMVLYVAVGLVCGMLVDRQRAAQARLRRTAEDLQETLREKDAIQQDLVRSERLAAVGQLSAGLAHEIRNPLASIKGSADILADDFPAEHPKGRFVRILQQESARLNDVLTRFLAFARPTDHGRGCIDLAQEMASVAELLRTRQGAPRVVVQTPPGEWYVDGDPVQIRQLLLNVALNAAAAAEGVVSLDVWRDAGYIAVAITDDGPGFADDALAAFGTPFFSTRPGGTGLGLAASVRIARDHGGSLSVDEAHSPGARVVLRLPAAAKEG
jgi:two-component system sensor histidine kinase HydH